MLSLVDLPLDVLDGILNALPDFATLGACILSCKALYNAYAARASSIQKAVIANNLGTGALFTLAMQTIRAEQRLAADAADRPDDLTSMRGLMLSMRDTKYTLRDVAPTDVSKLAERIQVSAGYEDIYSQRFKDKHSNTSCLAPEESDAFRTALLRIWLVGIFVYCGSVGVDAWSDWDFRNQFLYRPLSDQELYELLLVLSWLEEAVANEIDDITPFDTLFLVGFKDFLKAWQTRDHRNIDAENLELFWDLREEFGLIWNERDFSGVWEGNLEELQLNKSLKPLATYTGLLRPCSKCGKVEGKDPTYNCLYNSENWLTQKALAAIPLNHLPFYLGRYLSRNPYETRILGPYIFNPLHNFGEAAEPGADSGGNDADPPAKGEPLDQYDIMRSLFHLAEETESEPCASISRRTRSQASRPRTYSVSRVSLRCLRRVCGSGGTTTRPAGALVAALSKRIAGTVLSVGHRRNSTESMPRNTTICA